IVGLEEIGLEIVLLIAGRGHIRRCRIVGRRFDNADQRPFWQRGRRHIIPGLTAILRYMDQAIIRAIPEQAALERRFNEGEDRAVIFRTRIVLRDWPTGSFHPAGIVARQVGADNFPALALVGCAEDIVAGLIEDVGIVRREDNRAGPLEAVLQIARAPARSELGPDGDIARLARAVIVARDVALVVARVDDIGIIWPDRDIAAFATTDIVPIGLRNARPGRAIGHADGGVVLLRPVDAVGNLVIRRDMVELGRGLIIWGRPALAAIEGDAGPAIVPHDHPARIIGI